MVVLPPHDAQRRQFVIAGSVALVLCAAFGLLLQPALASLATRQSVSGLGLVVAGAAAAVSCTVRARRSTGRRRRPWALLAGAALVAILGNLWVAASGGSDPVTSPSTVSNVSIAVALVMSIVALLNFPSARRRGIDLVLMSLDGLIVGAAVLLIASALVYSELLDTSEGASVTGLTVLLIPMLDVLLATVALVLLLRSHATDRIALGLVAAGFIVYAVTDLAFAVRVAEERFEFGSVLDLGWIAGYLLIALAAWHPAVSGDQVSSQPGVSKIGDTTVVFGVVVIAAAVQVTWGFGDRLHTTQSVLWLVMILCTGARQTLLNRDNTSLRRGLELRVLEQTSDLRRLARETEVLLTSVGDGIYGVDLEGRLTFVNPSGAEALGFDPGALFGRSAHEKFHAPAADGTAYPSDGCYIAEAIARRVVTSAEEDMYVRADGETFPVEITASPLVDEATDEVRGAVVVFRDVTQRREVDRMKNEFLSIVSHELRTPLTSIRGSLGLLAGGTLGELTPRAASMAALALESTERLTRMINDILDLERIESGTQPMDLRAWEARDLLSAAAQEMRGLSRSTGVDLELGAASGRVVADRDRILQTLTNLLGNAVKFSPHGSTVILEAADEGAGLVVFRVRDQGRGIPAERLEAVFERFEQVDSSDARQKGGTGLGLAISRGIVERHGGLIWAESTLGVGTTVSFSLPVARVLGPEDDTEVSGAPTIVVCDDDPATVEVFCEMLQRHGYVTIGVTDGQEAVARMVNERPAALLLDLLMPGTTGAQVVAELKVRERTRDIPVVIVSGMGPQGGTGVPATIEEWLVKPVTEERLVATVARVLEGRLQAGLVLLVEDDRELAGVTTSLLASHGLRVVHAATVADAVRLGRDLLPQVVVLDLLLPDGDGYDVVAAFRGTPGMEETALLVYSAAFVEEPRRHELTLGPAVFLTKGLDGPEQLEDRVLELVSMVMGRL